MLYIINPLVPIPNKNKQLTQESFPELHQTKIKGYASCSMLRLQQQVDKGFLVDQFYSYQI